MATSETTRASDPLPPADAVAEGEDERLVRRAQVGDRAAFGALHARFAPLVHGVLVTLVRPTDAADLVQDVFLSALRSIAGLERVERVGPWLCTIARNRARDLYKARRHSMEIELDENLEPRAPDAPDPGEAETAARVLRALRALPEAYRETLSLRLVEGLSGPEIAHATGLTHGSVRVNLHRGMKLLKRRLGELGLEIEPR